MNISKLSLFYFILFLALAIGCETQEAPTLDEEISDIENGLKKTIVVKGNSLKSFSIEERMKYHKVPGLSIAIVRDGKIRWAKGYGTANTHNGSFVDTNTLFQAGSISKPVAALAVLKLVEEKKVDLDEDVNSYLKDWKVAENEFTKEEKVTLRKLLTHTAGITVHGFPGYQQADTFPTIEKVLNGEGNTAKIIADTIPGSMWRYSGGGYTIMEKVVEDVSGLPLEAYIQRNIMTPLEMENSTYQQPLPTSFHGNASAAYDSEGKIIEGLWHNYPEQAAAGSWTTPIDLAKYCIAIQEILSGKPDGILDKKTVEMMLTKHKNDWGLGPHLAWDADSFRFQHGGKNAGFTNNLIAFAHRGDAVIIMTNADNGGKLIGEIENSISSYYGWNIRNPRTVKVATLSPDHLNKFIGRYKHETPMEGVGEYFVDIKIENDKIILFDPNDGQREEMTPLDQFKFIDLEDGDELVFQISADSSGFKWNNRFQFYKVNKNSQVVH